MSNFSIDQGTIIYGIQSSKYPTIPCYGVIITARCDIAQKKVPKYYFLIAIDASDWLRTKHGYELVYRDKIKGLESDIICKADELDLNGKILLSLDETNLEKVLASKREEYNRNKSQLNRVEKLSEKIAEFFIFSCNTMDDSKRGEAIKECPKIAEKELARIYKGEQSHYYFLPQHAYLGNKVFNKGLIVDLLEIRELPIDDASRIESPGIDFQILPKLPTLKELIDVIEVENHQEQDRIIQAYVEHERLLSMYWLKGNSDFVCIDGTINSPWCEHLMQRYSNAFIRIGIEDPKDKDFKDIVKKCYQR